MHVSVNKYNYDFEKINILEYAFGEGGGGHQKAYAVYAFINVDNCERPLNTVSLLVTSYLAGIGWFQNLDPGAMETLYLAVASAN